MRRLPALVPWSATSRSRAAPCCSGSSSQSSSLWPSWRVVEGDVAGASGGWEVAAASAGSVAAVVSQAAAREGASSPHPFDPLSLWERGHLGERRPPSPEG